MIGMEQDYGLKKDNFPEFTIYTRVEGKNTPEFSKKSSHYFIKALRILICVVYIHF